MEELTKKLNLVALYNKTLEKEIETRKKESSLVHTEYDNISTELTVVRQ